MNNWQKPEIKPTLWWALFFLGIVLLLATFVYVFSSRPITNPAELWQRLGIGGLVSDPQQKFSLLDWDAKNKVWNFEWKAKGDYIRGVARLNFEQRTAQELLQKRKQELFSVYSNTIDPYFASGGQQVMTCGPEWQLKTLEMNAERIHFRAFATERMAYRACDPDSAFYRLDILYVYCAEAKVWLELEYFRPRRAEPLESALAIEKFTCNSSS